MGDGCDIDLDLTGVIGHSIAVFRIKWPHWSVIRIAGERPYLSTLLHLRRIHVCPPAPLGSENRGRRIEGPARRDITTRRSSGDLIKVIAVIQPEIRYD